MNSPIHMGKKSQKRSKKASHQENDEGRFSSYQTSVIPPEGQPAPPRIASGRPSHNLNPFYIESNSVEEEEEEHVGLLDYRSDRRDRNSDADEFDINPYIQPRRRNFSQTQQQQNQLYFEWKIRIGLIVAVMVLVTWILLGLLHENSPHPSSFPVMPPTSSPVIVKTHPPTMVPVIMTTKPISQSFPPSVSPEVHHGSGADPLSPVISASPTLHSENSIGDSGTKRNATDDDSSSNDNND